MEAAAAGVPNIFSTNVDMVNFTILAGGYTSVASYLFNSNASAPTLLS
jgi:hypothetical protein